MPLSLDYALFIFLLSFSSITFFWQGIVPLGLARLWEDFLATLTIKGVEDVLDDFFFSIS